MLYVLFYIVYFYFDTYLLKIFLNRSYTGAMLRPVFVFIMPLVALLFASGAYCIFLLGMNIWYVGGINSTDAWYKISPFQRKYGIYCNMIAFLFVLIGAVWGIYNLISLL
ncbi:hypothetical protein [Megamonas sp.]